MSENVVGVSSRLVFPLLVEGLKPASKSQGSRTNEPQTELEASALLLLAAHLPCLGIRRLSSTVRTCSEDEAESGTVRACPEATQVSVMNAPDYQDVSAAMIVLRGHGPVSQALLASFVSSVFRLKRRLNKYCT